MEQLPVGALVTADPDGDTAVELGEKAEQISDKQDKGSVLNALWGAADTPWKRRARAAARRNESMMIATVRVGERLEANVMHVNSKRHLKKNGREEGIPSKT